MNKSITVTGATIVMISIILGAFGAHALKERLEPEQLTSFETGVRYAMYHGLAFLLLGLTADKLPQLTWVFRLLFAGVLLFSGSIFLLSMQSIIGVEMRFLGPITPIGGVLLIAGWGLFIAALIRKN